MILLDERHVFKFKKSLEEVYLQCLFFMRPHNLAALVGILAPVDPAIVLRNRGSLRAHTDRYFRSLLPATGLYIHLFGLQYPD